MIEVGGGETIPPYPVTDLVEGVDFVHEDELVDVIAARLVDLPVDDVEELLVSGYNYDEPQERTVFWAMTIAEYREWVAQRQSHTPFHYGILAIIDSKGHKHGDIAIGVYNPDYFIRKPDSNEFKHRNGGVADEARIATFRVFLPFTHKDVLLRPQSM